MTAKKRIEETPSKYVSKRGLAFTEVAALKEEITRWIKDGFSALAIWKLLTEKKRISNLYGYRTFLRAVYRMIPDADNIVSRPTPGRGKKRTDTSRGGDNKQFQTVSNTKLI